MSLEDIEQAGPQDNSVILKYFLTYLSFIFNQFYERFKCGVKEHQRDCFNESVELIELQLSNFSADNKSLNQLFSEAKVTLDEKLVLRGYERFLEEISSDIEHCLEQYCLIISDSSKKFSKRMIKFEEKMIKTIGKSEVDRDFAKRAIGRSRARKYSNYVEIIEKLMPFRNVSWTGNLKAGQGVTIERSFSSDGDQNQMKKADARASNIEKAFEERAGFYYQQYTKRIEKTGHKTVLMVPVRSILNSMSFEIIYGMKLEECSWLDLIMKGEELKNNSENTTLLNDPNFGIKALIESNLKYDMFVDRELINDSIEFFKRVIKLSGNQNTRSPFKRINTINAFYDVDFLRLYVIGDGEKDLAEDLRKLLSIIDIFVAYQMVESLESNFERKNNFLENLLGAHKSLMEEEKKGFGLKLLSKRSP